jgi:hypothetical protein
VHALDTRNMECLSGYPNRIPKRFREREKRKGRENGCVALEDSIM